jgi:hypothetical protein
MKVSQLLNLLCSFTLQPIVPLSAIAFRVFPPEIHETNESKRAGCSACGQVEGVPIVIVWSVRR